MPRILKLVLVCIIAEALNFLMVQIFYHALGIPLFFDTIWTVAVVFYAGLLPALCVSLGYNIINSLIWIFVKGEGDPFIFLYSICGVLIVVSTWFIARRKDEFRINVMVTLLYLLMITLTSLFCTVFTSGIIDYFHLRYRNVPDMMNPIKSFTESFVHQHFSLLASCILAQIPVSFLDRLIATFAGYAIYRVAVRIEKK